MFVFLLSVVAHISELDGRNIALAKKVTCETNILNVKLTDGDHDILDPALIDACRDITIHLDGSYLVHYVILFEGLRSGKTSRCNLFRVQLESEKDIFICGTFLKKQLTREEQPQHRVGKRVNCVKPAGKFAVRVILQNTIKIPLSVAEIEVHSLAEEGPRSGVLIFRGCYRVTLFAKTEDGHSLSSCSNLCHDSGYIYIKGQSCNCANDLKPGDELLLKTCSLKCPLETDKFCGGENGYSVYIVNIQLPHFLGCFGDDLDCGGTQCIENESGMTPEMCLRFCWWARYAALKLGRRCICTDLTPTITSQILKCLTACPGDPTSYCGSDEDHSFYGTCVFEASVVPCSNLVQCDMEIDEYGGCPGRCRSGFVGDECLERDFVGRKTSTKFTATTKSRTAITTSATPTVTSATTATSTTTKTRAVEPNVTLNRCQMDNPCGDKHNSICHPDETMNYTCDCRTGYEKELETGNCQDVDECLTSPCDPITSTCTNTEGGYDCLCLPDYRKDNFSCSRETPTIDRIDPRIFVMGIFFVICGILLAFFAGVCWNDNISVPEESDSGSSDSVYEE